MSGDYKYTDSGNSRLRAEDVRDRLRGHLYLLYMNYAFFIKGAILAFAGVAIFQIFATENVINKLERETLWGVSFAYSLVTISAFSRGAILTNWHANIFDTILPISLGICEVLLYFILTPTPGDSGKLWTSWYVVFAAYALLAAALVFNRRQQARLKEFEQTAEMVKLAKRYRRWLLGDLLGALLAAAASCEMRFDFDRISRFLTPYGLNPHFVFGLALGILALFVLTSIARQYRALGAI
jgi:hypothetical protein